MHTISKTIELDAGHRVPLHQSKCKNLHGHRYSVQLSVGGPLISEGSETGMVKDFSFLKEVLNTIVHNPCDHALILDVNDPILLQLLGPNPESANEESGVVTINPNTKLSDLKASVVMDHDCHTIYGISSTKIYLMNKVPTAENLARHWGLRLIPLLPQNVELASIDVFETPTSIATWSI